MFCKLDSPKAAFPYFFVGTFIEAHAAMTGKTMTDLLISLLFRRDFH